MRQPGVKAEKIYEQSIARAPKARPECCNPPLLSTSIYKTHSPARISSLFSWLVHTENNSLPQSFCISSGDRGLLTGIWRLMIHTGINTLQVSDSAFSSSQIRRLHPKITQSTSSPLSFQFVPRVMKCLSQAILRHANILNKASSIKTANYSWSLFLAFSLEIQLPVTPGFEIQLRYGISMPPLPKASTLLKRQFNACFVFKLGEPNEGKETCSGIITLASNQKGN